MDDTVRVAALLCSRLCHDLVGAVAAIANGVDLVREEAGADMREQALALIAFNADELSRRIQFYRLAFGAPGGAIELTEARRVAEGLLAAGKVALDWPAVESAGQALPSVAAKLVLNLIQLGAETLPRGGALHVGLSATGSECTVTATARGKAPKVAPPVAAALGGTLADPEIDARIIQAHYVALLAAAPGTAVTVREDADGVALCAVWTTPVT